MQKEATINADVPFDKAPMQTDRTAGHAWFREQGPVFVDTEGRYYVTSAAGVREVLQRKDVFSSQQAFAGAFGTPFDLVPLAVDPPKHVKYRRVLDPLFSPRQIRPMTDELRRQVVELISAFRDRGRCDAMAELADVYPTQVFLEIFGLPLADRDRCMGWVRTINDNLQNGMMASPELVEAGEQLTAYLRQAIDDKRSALGDDLLSEILKSEGDDLWSEDEIVGFAWLFCLAGLDTVTATMGFVVHHLATHPELQAQLRDDPELVAPTVEELLRLETVVTNVPRVTTEDVEIEGHLIPAGSVVLVMLGSANRDDDRFAHPDSLDVDQADVGHFTFGGGIHRCVGSHLARLELRLAVEELLRLLPEFGPDPDFDPSVTWPASVLHFESLPLVWSTS